MLQVPHPLADINSFEYAIALFERLQAKSLLIGGTHPATNVDKSSDLIRYSNRKSIFSLVNQVVMREAGDDELLVIQSRALSRNADSSLPTIDVLLAHNHGIASQFDLGSLGKGLFDSLRVDGLTVKFVHGNVDTIGYEVSNLPQALYLSATQNKEFIVLWLSPVTRQYYRQQTEHNMQGVQFNALNIHTVTTELYQYITSNHIGNSNSISKDFQVTAAQYIQNQDILLLQNLIENWPQYRLERFIDVNSRQAFLLIYANKDKLSLVANLFPRIPDKQVHFLVTDGQTKVSRFIETRAGWLVFP